MVALFKLVCERTANGAKRDFLFLDCVSQKELKANTNIIKNEVDFIEVADWACIKLSNKCGFFTFSSHLARNRHFHKIRQTLIFSLSGRYD